MERSSVSPARPPARDAMAAPPVPLTLAGRHGKPPRHLADLDLAGLAVHGPRGAVDKIVKGARMHP